MGQRIRHISLTMKIKGAVADEAVAVEGTSEIITRLEVGAAAGTKREVGGEDTAPIAIITRVIILRVAVMGIAIRQTLIWADMLLRHIMAMASQAGMETLSAAKVAWIITLCRLSSSSSNNSSKLSSSSNKVGMVVSHTRKMILKRQDPIITAISRGEVVDSNSSPTFINSHWDCRALGLPPLTLALLAEPRADGLGPGSSSSNTGVGTGSRRTRIADTLLTAINSLSPDPAVLSFTLTTET